MGTAREDLNLRGDAGHVFASDEHRRVLGHLHPPALKRGARPVSDLLDPNQTLDPAVRNLGADGINRIVDELEADGLAKRHQDGGLVMTPAGHRLLIGPVADEPPPLTGDALARMEESNRLWQENEDKIIAAAKPEGATVPGQVDGAPEAVAAEVDAEPAEAATEGSAA